MLLLPKIYEIYYKLGGPFAKLPQTPHNIIESSYVVFFVKYNLIIFLSFGHL